MQSPHDVIQKIEKVTNNIHTVNVNVNVNATQNATQKQTTSTPPPPKLTLTLASHLGQNVGLGEGQVGSFLET